MSDFLAYVEANLKQRGIKLSAFYNPNDAFEKRIMKDYGAAFLNPDLNIKLPPRCRFADAAEHKKYLDSLTIKEDTIGAKRFKLQKAAMESLKRVEKKAGKLGLVGDDSAARTYQKVQDNWDNRVVKGAEKWRGKKNAKGEAFSEDDYKYLVDKKNSGPDQVRRVLALESKGFLFHSEGRSITVLVALPGGSQHLLLTAADIDNATLIHSELEAEGWFRTVLGDRPHYTYLAMKKADLKAHGLKQGTFDKLEFWHPDM